MTRLYIENLPLDATPGMVEELVGGYLGEVKREIELVADGFTSRVAIMSFPELSPFAIGAITEKFNHRHFAGKFLRIYAPIFD